MLSEFRQKFINRLQIPKAFMKIGRVGSPAKLTMMKLPLNRCCIKRHCSPKKWAPNFLRSLQLAQTYCSFGSIKIRLALARRVILKCTSIQAPQAPMPWLWVGLVIHKHSFCHTTMYYNVIAITGTVKTTVTLTVAYAKGSLGLRHPSPRGGHPN